MKLTNISLAILVALGLAACGGSDDNNDQTTDPKTPPKKEEPKKEETPIKDEEPKGDSNELDPTRKAPDLTVNDKYKTIVASRKRIFVDRTFSDNALGYDGYDYKPKEGTDPEDVKLTSTYNFLDENDVITKKTGKYTDDKVIGAIFVGEDPTNVNNNAYYYSDKDKGYIRVATKSTDTADKFTVDTKFYPVKDDSGLKVDDMAEPIDQKDIVFIANANVSSDKVGIKDKPLKLGKLTAPDLSYDKGANQVILQTVKVFGKEYDATSRGQNLDFGQMKVMKGIQSEDVTGTYQILNGKGTATSNDNFSMTDSIKVGTVKAYNLPYSIALVTTNVNEKNPSEKDIFGVGALNVAGFQTIALPKDGRAFYTGKSFNAKNTGDVELVADFFADRAGVSGTVFNRKDNKGNSLADLSLERIELTSPENHNVGGMGSVKGQPSYASNWTVNFYGPEAEEAAGKLLKETTPAVAATSTTPAVPAVYADVEVYNTQREELTNKSNTADTK